MTADMVKGERLLLRKICIITCAVFLFCVFLFPVSSQAFPVTGSAFPYNNRAQPHFSALESSPFLCIASNKGEVFSEHEDANSGHAAQEFVDVMARTALGFLADKSLDQDRKKAAFADLLNDSFDMKTIGRFSLGRYWRVSTKDQRREYLDLFQNMVINVYSERFLEYSGQKFETRNYRRESEKDTIVTSFVIPEDGQEIQVDWRIRYKDGRFQVVDVIVEGVSMSMTQRSDFSAVIQRGGGNISVLLDHLRGQ